MTTRREFLAAPALLGAAGRDARVRVSQRDPRYLELTSGEPYIPVGLNMIAPPAGDWGAFEHWLDALAHHGGNYIRVWLSNPYFDVEHARSGHYDAARAERIDRLLAACALRGIRVKMTLEHFRSIGEPPVRQQWADKPVHLKAHGGPAASIADFFDGAGSRAQFRRKIHWFAKRYRNNPTVFGWELWNEINAVRGGDYLAWTAAMLPELHRAFPRNMAMQSLGSFDTDRVRPTYAQHSTMPGNDVAQVHRYLDLGASLDVCKGPVDLLAADAVRELLAFQPRRPVLLAESGAVEPKHTGPFQLYKADKMGVILHDVLFAPFFSGAAGPGQIWHWDSYVAANDLWWHFGRFRRAIEGIDPRMENFRPDVYEENEIRAYRLTGSRTTLIWLRDTRNTWITELRDKIQPRVLEYASVQGRPGRGRFYDPWSDKWSDSLPAWSRSLVVRIE